MWAMELPEEHELIWLFEQEPERLDPDDPWAYNRITFSLQRGNDHLVCLISPAYGDVEIHLSRIGFPVLDLVLGHVSRLGVRKENGAESLLVDVNLERVNQLRVQTKPDF